MRVSAQEQIGRRRLVHFRVLGPVAVDVAGHAIGVTRPRQRAILGYLLLHRNHLVSTDRIVTALWDDDGPSTARTQVQTELSILRRHIRASGAPDPVQTRPTGYTIMVAAGALDLDIFTARVTDARNAADPTTAAELLRSALGMWTGPALDGVRAAYVPAHRLHLEEQRLRAYEQLFDLELDLGHHADICAELIDLVDRSPLRERLVAQLMLALYRSGRQTDALGAARALRAELGGQHGLDPGRPVQDLEQAILRSDPSLDLPAPPVPISVASSAAGGPTVPRQVPRDLYGMCGRTLQLAQLDECLSRIVVVTGTAGVGKTTLAIHWAHRVADRFPDGQLYVNLRGFDANPVSLDPAVVLRRFLLALGHEPRQLPDDLDTLVDLYRSRMAGRRMLVVLDNARDTAHVRPLLPGGAECAVLVTSRSHLPSLLAADGAQSIPLDVLSAHEAMQLMVRRLGPARIDADPGAAEDIIESCARLPLALAIASAHAAGKPAVPLRVIASELRNSRAGLSAFRLADEDDDIAAVFSWSFGTLSSGAASVFRVIGNHPIPEVSLDAAASMAGLPATEVGRRLAELTGANLVTEFADRRFTMHDLLRAYARENSDTADAQDAVRRLLDHYLHSALAAALQFQPGRRPIAIAEAVAGVCVTVPASRDDAIAWLQTEHGALITVITQAGSWGFDAHVCQLAWCLSQFLYFQGQWADWARVQEAALDAARRLGDLTAMARSHQDLGRALLMLGRHTEAEEQIRHARSVAIEIGDRRIEALSLQTMSDLYRMQKRDEDSLAMLVDALAIYDTMDNPLGRAQTLNNLGVRHMHLGNYHEALTFCTEALAVFESKGEVHGACAVHDSLARIFQAQGTRDKAVEQFQLVLALNRELGEPYIESETLINLADLYATGGDHDAAAEALRQALDILDQLNHANAAEVRGRLAALAR